MQGRIAPALPIKHQNIPDNKGHLVEAANFVSVSFVYPLHLHAFPQLPIETASS